MGSVAFDLLLPHERHPDRLVTGGAVEKHISNIFAKINLPDLGSDNRRVLAVLAWLRAR
jgi:hypothetical protein